MVDIPSPAVAVVGRHNSGKTTLVVSLIEELVSRGRDVGSVKHHHREGFEIDIPGKDSYRHRHAGASETVIASPGQMACIKTVEGELECTQIVKGMPGHDIVIVEGYRNCFCFKQWIWEEPDRIKYFAIEILVLFVSALLLYKRLKPSLYEIA